MSSKTQFLPFPTIIKKTPAASLTFNLAHWTLKCKRAALCCSGYFLNYKKTRGKKKKLMILGQFLNPPDPPRLWATRRPNASKNEQSGDGLADMSLCRRFEFFTFDLTQRPRQEVQVTLRIESSQQWRGIEVNVRNESRWTFCILGMSRKKSRSADALYLSM